MAICKRFALQRSIRSIGFAAAICALMAAGCGDGGGASSKAPPTSKVETSEDKYVNMALAIKNSKAKDIRLGFLKNLGGLGKQAKSAVPTLKEVLSDSDPDIKQAVEACIKKIE